jgi:galactose-1-phosphate uridylyltransferase
MQVYFRNHKLPIAGTKLERSSRFTSQVQLRSFNSIVVINFVMINVLCSSFEYLLICHTFPEVFNAMQASYLHILIFMWRLLCACKAVLFLETSGQLLIIWIREEVILRWSFTLMLYCQNRKLNII